MDRYLKNRPANLSLRTQAAEPTKPMGTTSYNSTDLDKLPPDSSNQMDGADLDDGKDAVPVGTSIFGPFNTLTASNLKILRRQQISKGIRGELAKVRDLRMYLRTLQITNPDFASESKHGVGTAAYQSNETKVSESTSLIMETPGYSTSSHKTTSSRVPSGGVMTPQSLEEQAEQDPFDSTPAPQNPTTPDIMPEPYEPSLTLSGATVIDSATPLVPAPTRKEKKVVPSSLGSIPEDNTTPSANATFEPQAPRSTCSEDQSDVHTTTSVAYSRCRQHINLQMENVRDWIKKGRAARKAERAVQREQRSSRSSSRVNYQGFLLGTPTVSTAGNETGEDGRITKLLADLEANYEARISAVEAKYVAKISAVEQACEFKVGELNTAFGARLADLEDERELVHNKIANTEKKISILADEIEVLADSEAIPGTRQNQQGKSRCGENAASTYKGHGMGPGQGEAFRI